MSAEVLAVRVFAAAAGAAVGSFCGTAAVRGAGGATALVGRSRCDACGVPLGFLATAPLVSFVRLGGRCATCRAPIALVHPAAEAAGAVAGLALVWLAPPGLWVPGGVALAASLYGSAFDAGTQRIPDLAPIAIAAMGLASAWIFGELAPAAVTGAVAGGLLLALALGFRGAAGRSGLGLGDVKLTAALATWTGPLLTPLAVSSAALLGLAWFALRGRLRSGERLAFAPFLCLAFWPAALGRLAT